VAPDAKPQNAHESLQLRLRQLTRLVRDTAQNRAALLSKYRKEASAASYTGPEPFRSPYLEELFPYIHNEFLFNSARKIGPLAQVSHLVFAPVYVDRMPADSDGRSSSIFPNDPMKVLDYGTSATLRWLWKRAIHATDPKSDFRGGKDDIFELIQGLQDFSEPYATPKRYIYAIKDLANELCSKEARNETQEHDNYFRRSGYSNILANSVEFFWRASRGRKGHFRWARHDRPYQTFTFSNEYARTADKDADPVPLGSEDWTKAIVAAIGGGPEDGVRKLPFDLNALQDLKLDVFGRVMGRYTHGANLLVLPLKLFLNHEIAPRYADSKLRVSLLENLLKSAPRQSVNDFIVEKWRNWASKPDADGLWDEEFRDLMRGFQGNEARAAQLDSLVIGATLDFLLEHCFLADENDRFDSEFVGYKCMGGRAYVFTDVRNRPHRKKAEHEGLFSRTVIIDCGLNNYERGRLIQTITEFATERVMSLQWLARFRLVHHALNVVQTRVSVAFSNYQSDEPQSEETLPFQRTRVLYGAEGLLNSLEFLSSCLSILNDVIEGGIMDRSSASLPAHNAILNKLESIREQPLQGYQSLSEYLERRYARPLRTIARVGERYEMLRRRITEIAELVNVRMQAEQNERQVSGIVAGIVITVLAMILALVALPHPLGETIKELGWGNAYVRAVMISGAIGVFYFLFFLRYRPKFPNAKRRRAQKY
jgi:hypothetical protein